MPSWKDKNDKRTGSVHDVKYFEIIEEDKAAAKKPAKKAAAYERGIRACRTGRWAWRSTCR